MSHAYSDHVARAIREHKQRMHDKAIIEGRPVPVAEPAGSVTMPGLEVREISPESWFGALAPSHWSIQA